MKKTFIFINLFSLLLLFALTLPNSKVGASDNLDFIITSSKALDYEGDVIPDSYGIFMKSSGEIYYKSFTFNKRYEVLKSSIPDEMYDSNGIVTTLFKVGVIDGYWAYANYSYAYDINDNIIPEGVGKLTKSLSVYTDEFGNTQRIFEFAIYFRDGFILENTEYYSVDSADLPDKIKATWGTNYLVAVKNRAWSLTSDIKISEKTLDVNAYVELVLLSSIQGQYIPNSPNYKVPFIYLNFDIPISSIKQIDISFIGVNTSFFGLIKDNVEISYSIKSNSNSVLDYRNHYFDCIQNGDFTFNNSDVHYYWKITPSADNGFNADYLLIDYVKDDSIGISKLVYEYMECTYIYVEGELADLKITQVDGPGLESSYISKNETFFDKLINFFKNIFIYIIVILVFVFGVYIFKNKKARRT